MPTPTHKGGKEPFGGTHQELSECRDAWGRPMAMPSIGSFSAGPEAGFTTHATDDKGRKAESEGLLPEKPRSSGALYFPGGMAPFPFPD